MTSALQAELSPAVLMVVVWEVGRAPVLVTPTTSRALRLMGSGPGIRTGCGQGVARLCASMPGASGGREPPNGPGFESSGGSFTPVPGPWWDQLGLWSWAPACSLSLPVVRAAHSVEPKREGSSRRYPESKVLYWLEQTRACPDSRGGDTDPLTPQWEEGQNMQLAALKATPDGI